MSWVGVHEAMVAWGLSSPQAVHARFSRNPDRWPSKKDPDDAHRRLYWIGDSPPLAMDGDAPHSETHPAPSTDRPHTPVADPIEVPVLPASLSHAPDDGWVERAGYIYDGDRDLYVLHLPSQRKPYPLPGERVRQIWRRYAGEQATAAEVCREFGLDRQTWKELRRALDLTKTRAPFTDEELDARPEADLLEDLTRAKERRVMAEAERREWRAIKRIATKRRWLRQAVRDALAGSSPIAPLPPPQGEPEDVCVVVGWSDLHVGKREAGQSRGLQHQLDALRSLAADVAARVAALCPSHVVLACTGDLVHSDTQTQTTTKGTPQGPQSEGSTAMALRGACEVTAALVSRLSEAAPSVEVVVVPGNHDELLSRAVGLYLEGVFADAPRVTVDADETRRRKWATWRKVPLCFFHGDKLKGDRLASLPGRECPAGADPTRAVLFHGHLHKRGLRQDVVGGFDVVCLASPAGADDWHHEMGFEGGAKAITLAVLAPSGLTALEWVRAVDERTHS